MDPKELLRPLIEPDTEEAEQLDEFRPRFFHKVTDQLEFLDRLADEILEKYAFGLEEHGLDVTDKELEERLLRINDPKKSITGEIATHGLKKRMRAAHAYDKLLRLDKATLSFSERKDLQWLQLAYLIHAFVPRWLTDGFDPEEDAGWLLFIGFVHGRLHAGSVDRSPFLDQSLADFLHAEKCGSVSKKRWDDQRQEEDKKYAEIARKAVDHAEMLWNKKNEKLSDWQMARHLISLEPFRNIPEKYLRERLQPPAEKYDRVAGFKDGKKLK